MGSLGTAVWVALCGLAFSLVVCLAIGWLASLIVWDGPLGWLRCTLTGFCGGLVSAVLTWATRSSIDEHYFWAIVGWLISSVLLLLAIRTFRSD